MNAELLKIEGLSVTFRGARNDLYALRDVSFSIGGGEMVGIVGESGCGKSTLLAAVSRTLPASAKIDGRIVFEGTDLTALSETAMRQMRGRKIGTIVQNPMTALDPLFTIGNQIEEVLKHRAGAARESVGRLALDALQSVQIAAPKSRLKQYPHQLSGGMRQRVLIAMNACCRPKLLLADEPTTALDVTVQESILQLFQAIRHEQGASIILVTHDLGVVRKLCDRVLVMYAGRIVEQGQVPDVFDAPMHPYTRALVRSIPSGNDHPDELYAIPGQVPDLTRNIVGCAFAQRCEIATSRCHQHTPDLTGPDLRRVACWEQPRHD